MKGIAFLLALSMSAVAQSREPIRLFAAGSLRAALNEVAAAYPVKVEVVYGPSGLLRERIVKGERPDLFASANMEHPRALTKDGLAGRVRRFTRNRLCALAAPGIEINSATLLDRMLDPAVKLGTSTPKADPSGDYAWQLFAKAERVRPGSRAALEKKALQLLGGRDTPPVPAGRSPYGTLIAEGKADLFLAYCTGAVEAKNENAALQIVQVPPELAVAADYGLTLVKGARAEAWNFAHFILSPKGQDILARHGFSAEDDGVGKE